GHMPGIGLEDLGNIFLVAIVPAPGALDLKQKRHAGIDDGKQLLERQDAITAVAQPDGADLRSVARSNGPSLGGQMFQNAVVEDDRKTIARALEVNLDRIVLGNRCLDRECAVLD